MKTKYIIGLLSILFMASFLTPCISDFIGKIDFASINIAPVVSFVTLVGGFACAAVGLPPGIMGLNHADLTKETTDNMGGIGVNFYWALADDVLTWPTITAVEDAADYEALSTLSGDFVMKTGKRFFSGYMTLDNGELTTKMQGGLDCHSYKNELKITNPGLKKKLRGFMRATQNEKLVIVVTDAEGQKLVLGSEQFPAIPDSGDGTTGKASGDSKQVTLGFYSCSNGPVMGFEGDIPLTPAGSGSGI